MGGRHHLPKCVQEFWRDQSGLHINIKELQAAVHTLKSLAEPREVVTLGVDNLVAFWYLKKGGGRLPHFNSLMRDLWEWVMKHQIHLEVQLLPSSEDQADGLSRAPLDKGDYTLMSSIFRKFCHLQNFHQHVDMFASPGNHKLPLFVGRWPHWQNLLTDALNCPLQGIETCYANPPWNLILPWLTRLRDHPQLISFMVPSL